MRPRPTVFCSALLLLAACSSTTATNPVPRPSASPSAIALPVGWTLRSDRPQGYSLAIPDGWDHVVRDSPSYPADLRAVSLHSPELAGYFKQSLSADAQVQFIAADSSSLLTGFAANVHVMTGDLGPLESAARLKDLADAKVKLLSGQASVIRPVKRTADRLSGLPAVRLDYWLAGSVSPMVRSYLVVAERSGRVYEYELTMGALPDAAATAFATLGQFFTLFPPARAQ